MNRKLLPGLLLLAASLLMSGNVWSAQAGLIQFVIGKVSVTSEKGELHELKKGDPVNEGDTITTAQGGMAQIKMLDGGFVAVRSDSQLKVDSFKFSGKAGEPEKSTISLVKGGMRAVTGLIGRINKSDYQINSKFGSIGIRGTDHETVIVLPESPLAAAGLAAAGVYNKVNVGETSITTEKGTISIMPNQMGYAGGVNQVPKIQPINTNLFTVAPPASAGAKMDAGKKDGQSARLTTEASASSQSSTATTTTSANATGIATTTSVTPAAVVQTFSSATSNSSAISTSFVDLSVQTNPAQTVSATKMTSYWVPSSVGQSTYTFDSTGLVAMSVSCSSCTLGIGTATIGTAQNADVGGVSTDIKWGRWTNGTTTESVIGNETWGANQGWSYLVGTPTATLPTSGTFTYSLIGGTSPTVSNNVGGGLGLGHLISGGATVNFGTSTLSGNLLMGFNSSSIYNLTYNATISSPYGAVHSTSATATFQSGGINVCSSGCPGGVGGVFYGTNATYFGIAYTIIATNSAATTSTTSNVFAINGVAAYKK